MINYADMLSRQMAWARATFGPGERRNGTIQHIRKEIVEFQEAGDISEAVDIVVLAHDLLTRRIQADNPDLDFDEIGHLAAGAVKRKLLINEQRVWPDWRQYDQDTAIEHDRSHD